jgi:hypothetical protein
MFMIPSIFYKIFGYFKKYYVLFINIFCYYFYIPDAIDNFCAVFYYETNS